MRAPDSDSKRSRIFSRSRKAYISGVPHRAHVLSEKADHAGMILQAGQLADDDADVFGPLRHLNAGQLLDRQGVGPVVGHRAEVIEAVGVGDRPQVAAVLSDLLVIAVQVAEHRLESHDRSPSSWTSMRKTPWVDG